MYVFQKDTNDNIDRIFPNPVWNADNNPLAPDRFPLRIPPNKEEYLYVDEMPQAAEETIYVIASLWKAEDIEKIYGKIHQETDKGIRHQQIRQFLIMLELRKNAGLPSVFYKEFSF
ncbi:MAG: DUF4384 domain-containing protein, partial [Desulfobacteraceae bacterium]|nr:DUF4384 domain-containing protein [Desulfobacteraceae bacterium]